MILPDMKRTVVNLSPSYNFMMVADLGETFSQPENYVRLIPAFFFRNQVVFPPLLFFLHNLLVRTELYIPMWY
mgnify:CR=1 FL=1